MLQLKEKKPDVVIFISYTADSILYMKTMKNLDYLPPMVLGDDSGSPIRPSSRRSTTSRRA